MQCIFYSGFILENYKITASNISGPKIKDSLIWNCIQEAQH